jgi:hypothetical protein
MNKEIVKPTMMNPWSESAQIGQIIMDSIIVTIWYKTIFPWHISWIFTFVFLMTVMFFGFFSVKFIKRIRLKPLLQRWFFVIIILILIPLTLKIFAYQDQVISLWGLYYDPIQKLFENITQAFEFLHILFILGLIVRSTWLANILIDTNQIIRSMQFGIIIIIIYGAFFTWQDPSPNILPISLFLFTSLFTLGLSRLATSAYSKGGQITGNTKKWVVIMFTSTIILLILSIGIGSILGLRLSNFITIIFFMILAAIIFLAIIIASPFILISSWIINQISNSLTNAPPEPFESNAILENPLTKAILNEVDNLETLINAPGLAQIIIYFAIFLILIFLIFTFLKKNYWNPPLSAIEENSTINSIKNKSLNDFQPDWLRKLRKYSLNQSLSLYQIRRIYNQFLKVCQKDLDFPRKDAETPIEFCNRLSKMFPILEQDVLQITNSYNLIRYGMQSETNQDLDLVKISWRKISSQISKFKK